MTIFTDRDLECVASLQANWRTKFLLEVVRLRRQRETGANADRRPATEKARWFEGGRSAGLKAAGTVNSARKFKILKYNRF